MESQFQCLALPFIVSTFLRTIISSFLHVFVSFLLLPSSPCSACYYFPQADNVP